MLRKLDLLLIGGKMKVQNAVENIKEKMQDEQKGAITTLEVVIIAGIVVVVAILIFKTIGGTLEDKGENINDALNDSNSGLHSHHGLGRK